MQETEAKIESYEELKENLLVKLRRNFDVNVLKQHFRRLVDSDRTLCTVQSVEELLMILEERDYLNEDNLDILDGILTFLEESHMLDENTVTEMRETIDFHRKEFDCKSECHICFKEIQYLEDLVHLTPSAPQISPSYVNNSLHPTAPQQQFFHGIHQSELDAVISYISKHIGKDWRPFASFLCVQEKKILEIYNKYKQDAGMAAFEALSEWKKHSYNKTERENINELLKFLQRKNVYYLNNLAKNINNGEHKMYWQQLEQYSLSSQC